MGKPKLLVTGSRSRGFEEFTPYAEIYWLEELREKELDRLLPSIDCIFVSIWWPDELTPDRISRMDSLRFIQSGMAGVNHIPFASIGKGVLVSSNAGGFSRGVAEFALALTLAAVKRVVKLDLAVRQGFEPKDWGKLSREIAPLQGMTLGVLGYGGIGRALGSMARPIGMRVVAFSRRPVPGEEVRLLEGPSGLLEVMGSSDAVVIALPLTKRTAGLVGARELGAMKENAVLVNVARAEIVDEDAIYARLKSHPRFIYATDVWQIREGKETYSSKHPLAALPNFIGTPHVAGASAAITGEPARAARENLLRYLRGEPPLNVVDPSEYV